MMVLFIMTLLGTITSCCSSSRSTVKPREMTSTRAVTMPFGDVRHIESPTRTWR